ncbi:MAG TPA: acyltransferase [Cytophagaceae bacterium]
MNHSDGLLAPKAHYPILDGLRGVAALTVVAFHIFEAYSTSHLDIIINHGYLAVDFFFLLSGFVIAYAYDDRWTKMSFGNFFRRRLERLQPMVIMGMAIGALGFYFQASALFPAISSTPVWLVIVTMICGFFMIPLPPSMDRRGWNEMYPLNGPGWSLFFEYFVNILYGLFIHRFSKTALSILVFLVGSMLIHFAVTNPNGDVIGGWSLEPAHMYTGFTRVLFPFFAGLLLFRISKLGHIKNAFLWCSLLLLLVLAMPRIGGSENVWMNGIYDAFCIIIIFPLIVWMGASGELTNPLSAKVCKFLGDISYPIYITHYPFIYAYTAWVVDNKISLREGWPMGLLVFISSIVLAYVCLKFYDEPVRAWLKRRALTGKSPDLAEK